MYALNQTATSPDIELTLLTVAFVDDVMRIAGFGRMLRRTEMRVAGLPVLRLAPPGGPSLVPAYGHVLPDRRAAWLSWVYERPAEDAGEYEARIEQIEVASSIGRWRPEPLAGPWMFAFQLPLTLRPVRLTSRFD